MFRIKEIEGILRKKNDQYKKRNVRWYGIKDTKDKEGLER